MESININLGKINTNKVKEIIRDLEFKGKTRTEINTYLDYTTEEFKESRTNLTNLFGDIDKIILNFLNGLYDKYKEINESNFKEFAKEIIDFSENYKYIEVDLRKTEEELKKEKTELETERKNAEEENAKRDRAIKESGNLTHSEKISIGTKEIAKQIREKLKKIERVNFSVTIESYSGGSSISVYLMKSNFKVVEDFKNLSEEAIFKYKDDGMRTEEQLKEMQEGGHHQISQFIEEEYNKDVWNNGVFLTKEGHTLFLKVMEIVNFYNYDNSDGQTDYYDVNFYIHLNIGKCDKPYIYDEKAEEPKTEIKDLEEITFKRNKEKGGLEIYFKSKPSEEIRQTLKENGFRWGRFNRCWYKKYNDELEAEIKKVLVVC